MRAVESAQGRSHTGHAVGGVVRRRGFKIEVMARIGWIGVRSLVLADGDEQMHGERGISALQRGRGRQSGMAVASCSESPTPYTP